MVENMKYEVCVRCMTFNQAKYITETMNGFVIQKTNFPFVCCIIDDASTDGEQEVIMKYVYENFVIIETSCHETEYAKIYYAQHNTNKNCFFAVYLLNENHYSNPEKFRGKKYEYIKKYREASEYEAVCEGDDYWTSPNKLQIQVDFLNQNKDYVMVHTDFDLVEGVRSHYKEIYENGDYLPRGIYNNGFDVGTMTVLYRREVYDRIPKYFNEKNWMMGDKPLWYELAHEGKIKYIPQVTAKYRVLTYSASHSKDLNRQLQFIEDGIEITKFYADKFNIQLTTDFKDKAYYVKVMKNICKLDGKKYANRYMLIALKEGHYSNKLMFFYLCSLCPIFKKSVTGIFNYRF